MGSAVSGLIPQSKRMLLFGVCNKMQLLPTSLKEPNAVILIQSVPEEGSIIFFPKLVKNFLRVSEFAKSELRIPFSISLGLVGERKTRGLQPVVVIMLFKTLPDFPMTIPGFKASIQTSLKGASSLISFTPASGGISFLISSKAFSGSINSLESHLNKIFFLILEAILVMRLSSS